MNNKIMKNLFLITLHIAFSFSVNGMEFDLPIPRSPGATAVAAAPAHVPFPELTTEQIAELNEVVQLTWNMISKLRQRFAEKDLNVAVGVPFNKLQKKISDFLPLFKEFFKIDPKKGFTPLNKALLNKFERSIEMLSPTSFVKSDNKSFEASVEMDSFPVVLETHNDSIGYIPEWLMQTSFALYRKSKTDTIIDPSYKLKTQTTTGKYNLLHMLNGDNPESSSGRIEYHHLYQTNGHFTPLCFSYHKQDYKRLHRAKGKSLINRANCASDFYYTNKYIAGIQILRMLKIIFEYNEEAYGASIPSNTKELINAILRSPGNIDVIPHTSSSKAGNSSLLSALLAEAENDFPSFLSYSADQESSSSSSRKNSIGSDTDSMGSDSSYKHASRRDSFSSGITDTSCRYSNSRDSLDSAASDEKLILDDSNSRDSIASSSSLVQQVSRVSIGSVLTDNSSGDEILKKSTYRQKRNHDARKKADSEDPLTDKENQETNSPERKKIVRGKNVRNPTILGTHS